MPNTENCSKEPNEHIQNFQQHTALMPSQKGSKWRPALRKIKGGIFSRKDCSRPDLSSPGAPLPFNETNQQRLDQQIQLSTTVEDTRDSFHSSSRESSRTAVSSKSSEYSLELKDSKGYNFFRPRFSTPARKIEAAKNKLVEPQQHERAHTNTTRPTSSAHVPEYPGKPWEHDPLMHRPSTAAYIPQHAASDFNQMSIGRSYYVDNYTASEVHINGPPFELDHPVVVPTAAVESDDSSDEFQEFLAQSRAEEARILESSRLHSPNKILPTQAENRTRIEANYSSGVKDRSTTSIPSASRRGSLFEHVAEYIKPSEAGGVRRSMEASRRPVERSQSRRKMNPNPLSNQRTSLSRPVSRTESFLISVGEYIKPVNQGHLPGGVNKGRTSINGNLAVGDARDTRTMRWSLRSGTSRRSMSQARDGEGDRKGSQPVDSSTSGKHRSSRMPISPGLHRYNQGIRKGLY